VPQQLPCSCRSRLRLSLRGLAVFVVAQGGRRVCCVPGKLLLFWEFMYVLSGYFNAPFCRFRAVLAATSSVQHIGIHLHCHASFHDLGISNYLFSVKPLVEEKSHS
jgi:hypothetical protein